MAKKLFLLNIIILSILLTACVTTFGVAEQNGSLKIWGESENGVYDTLVVVDSNTGVNYVVVSYNASSVSITPRLNADGSLYVTK